MKLYLVHCGFYDSTVCDGIYESHVDLFMVAENFESARLKIKSDPVFRAKRMHIDGLQEVEAVCGYRIQLANELALEGETRVIAQRHRERALSQKDLASLA